MTAHKTKSVFFGDNFCRTGGAPGVRLGDIGEPEREIVAPDPRPVQVPDPKTEPSKPQPREPQPA